MSCSGTYSNGGGRDAERRFARRLFSSKVILRLDILPVSLSKSSPRWSGRTAPRPLNDGVPGVSGGEDDEVDP